MLGLLVRVSLPQESLHANGFNYWGEVTSTIRFWESLRAGAIPVLISDQMRLPAAKEFDWRDCLVTIKEDEFAGFGRVLAEISPEKEEEMRRNCLKAYRCFSGSNFVKCIRDYYS